MIAAHLPVYVVLTEDQGLDVCNREGAPVDLLFPLRGGSRRKWSDLLVELEPGYQKRLISGRECVIELEPDADDTTKQVIRLIGHALYAQGATRVTCHSRTIARAA